MSALKKTKTLVKNASGDLDLDRGGRKKKANPEDLAAGFDNFGFTSNQSPEPEAEDEPAEDEPELELESKKDSEESYDSEEPVDEES
jgi:hypothetical protein